MKKTVSFVLLLMSAMLLKGCKEPLVNPYYPNAIINFTIYPNTIHEYELNTVGGFKYYTSDPLSTSRGIIVYRLSQDEFRAYDRIPPNNPDCRDENGTRHERCGKGCKAAGNRSWANWKSHDDEAVIM